MSLGPYEVQLTKEAMKDAKKLPPKLKTELEEILLNTIAANPFFGKKAIGGLEGLY